MSTSKYGIAHREMVLTVRFTEIDSRISVNKQIPSALWMRALQSELAVSIIDQNENKLFIAWRCIGDR